jgi:hypothetical protein
VPLERGVSLCAELHDFSCYRRRKEACQATRAISTTSRPELTRYPRPARNTPKEIHAFLTQTLGEYTPLYTNVKCWVAQFKRADFSTCDAPRPGPKTGTTPGIIYQIHDLIFLVRQISAKTKAQLLGISGERVRSIIHEEFDMRKMPAKWVPKCQNADQIRQLRQWSERNFGNLFIMMNYKETSLKNIEIYYQKRIKNCINIKLLINHFPSFLQ